MAGQRVVVIRSDDIGWEDFLRILGGVPGARVASEAADYDAALSLVTRIVPDVVVAPPYLHERPTLPLLREIRQQLPNCVLVIASSSCDARAARSLAGLGLASQVAWSDLTAAVLRDALIAALSGQVFLASRSPAQCFVQRLDHDAAGSPLTKREHEVLMLVAAGLHDVEIAQRLHRKSRTTSGRPSTITASTVETHIENICRKLGATNRCHAVALAMGGGIIEGRDS
jgi:two-component system response regulator EvgA